MLWKIEMIFFNFLNTFLRICSIKCSARINQWWSRMNDDGNWKIRKIKYAVETCYYFRIWFGIWCLQAELLPSMGPNNWRLDGSAVIIMPAERVFRSNFSIRSSRLPKFKCNFHRRIRTATSPGQSISKINNFPFRMPKNSINFLRISLFFHPIKYLMHLIWFDWFCISNWISVYFQI